MRNLVLAAISSFLRALSLEELWFLDRALHRRVPGGALYPEHLHYAYWEKQADYWDLIPSPVRPSRKEMEVYRVFWDAVAQKRRILVLGSTPELRDLAAEEEEARVYVADFSPRMMLEMSKFTRRADPLKEKWVKDNWLELAFPERFFDVVLGDLALQQFPPELEGRFLDKVSSLLANHGVFLGRFHFLDDRVRRVGMDSIITDALAAALTDREKFSLIKFRVTWLSVDLEKRKLDRRSASENFDEFIRAHRITHRVVRQVSEVLRAHKDSYRDWAPPSEDVLMKMLGARFTISGRAVADDYPDAEYYPLLALAPLR